MTNLAQVKNLLSITGSGSDASITDWLIAGGRVIAELIPMDKASQFAVVETPAISYDLTNKKFLSINSTTGSHFIPTSPELFIRASTVGSIYEITPTGSQYYTIDGDLLKVTSVLNSLKTYTYPAVTNENITNLPTEYIHGAVLYAASNAITKLLIDTNYDVSQVSITMPDPPIAPNLVYDDVSETVTISDGAVTTVDVVAYVPPIYTVVQTSFDFPILPIEPSLSYGSVSDSTTIADGLVSTVTVTTYVPPVLVLNDINALITASPLFAFDAAVTHVIPFPAISYQGSSTTGPSAVNIASIVDLVESFTPNPALTMPTTSFTLDMGSVALPTNITDALLNAIISTDVSPLLSDLTVTITELNAYFTTLDTTDTGYINGLEDVELAQSKMNEMQIKLKEVETELSLKLQEQLKNVEQKNDVEKHNKAQILTGLIQKVEAWVKRYSIELQKFQAQFTLRSNEAQLKQQGELAKIKSEIDIQTGRANEKMLTFKTAVEKLFEQAKIDLQRQLQLSSLTTDIAQKNAVAQYQQTVSSNEAAIKGFSVDLEQWVQTQNLKFGKFKTTIELYLSDNQSKIQDFQVREAKALNTFNTALSQVKEDYQKNIAITSLNVQKAIKKVEIETDIKKQNALQTYIASYNTYQEKMSRFVQDVALLQVKIQRDVALINSNIQNNQVKEVVALNTFNTALSEVRENYQKDIAMVSLNVQKAIKKAEIETDIKKQNELHTYVARYNTYQESMSRFAQQVGLVQVQVQRDMALINSNIQNNESQKQKLMGLQKMLLEQFNQFIMLMFPRQQPAPQQ